MISTQYKTVSLQHWAWLATSMMNIASEKENCGGGGISIMVEGVELLHSIQDVYLESGVTIA